MYACMYVYIRLKRPAPTRRMYTLPPQTLPTFPIWKYTLTPQPIWRYTLTPQPLPTFLSWKLLPCLEFHILNPKPQTLKLLEVAALVGSDQRPLGGCTPFSQSLSRALSLACSLALSLSLSLALSLSRSLSLSLSRSLSISLPSTPTLISCTLSALNPLRNSP